jgi:hypothetical protein
MNGEEDEKRGMEKRAIKERMNDENSGHSP